MNPQRPPQEETIAICGAAGRFGQLLVRRLHRTHSVLAIDARSFETRPADVPHKKHDLKSRHTRNVFRRGAVHAVIYINSNTRTDLRDSDIFSKTIENFARLLEYCDQYRVRKLILLSSADVYGARPGNSQFLSEDSPLLASEFSALRDIDIMAQSFFWKRPDIDTVILRPTHITGGVSGVLSRYLRLSTVPMLFGYDPMIQLVHEEDVVDAISTSLRGNCRGIFNIGGPSCLPLSTVIQMLGKKTVQIPHILAKPALRHMNKLRLMEFHPAYVDYLRYVCMVDDSRARQVLGYAPKRSINETVNAVNVWE